MKEVKKGIYEHYKGKRYEVTGWARHSETLEPMVVYRTLYKTEFPEDMLWVRPLEMFTENVTVDGQVTPRFRYIEGSSEH
ncbi:MAG: DUF1653 domain-containing protein [Candidatus Omnitrophica bacterium]|nr:DUF1653 domain-containing protein [Candidatus Omnitrophota bacterium]